MEKKEWNAPSMSLITTSAIQEPTSIKDPWKGMADWVDFKTKPSTISCVACAPLNKCSFKDLTQEERR